MKHKGKWPSASLQVRPRPPETANDPWVEPGVRLAAKTIQKLAALFVGRVKEPGMYADGGGLYLQVTSSGAKSWIFRFEINGRERAMGLGSLNAVGLSEARTQAEECRALPQRDIDPIEHRKEARAQAALDRANTISFGEAATHYIDIDSHKAALERGVRH